MPDRYVTVHRGADAVEAEILRDVLVDAGIDARLLGLRQEAPLGVTPATTESRVDVPAPDVEEARAVVAGALQSLRAPVVDEDAGDSVAEPLERPLRPLLAAGVVPVCPGGGHFYARRPLTAVAIAAGELAAVIALAHGGTRGAWGALTLVLLMLADLAGAQLAVRAWNRGARATQLRQALRGLLMLLGAGTIANALVPAAMHAAARRHGRHTPYQELHQGAPHPGSLPFPLHLDLRR